MPDPAQGCAAVETRLVHNVFSQCYGIENLGDMGDDSNSTDNTSTDSNRTSDDGTSDNTTIERGASISSNYRSRDDWFV